MLSRDGNHAQIALARRLTFFQTDPGMTARTRLHIMKNRTNLFLLLPLLTLAGVIAMEGADFHDPNADREALPTVPSGFEVTFFAREPLVRQPCSLAFDSRGRLCVGMGPQYRNPKPETPGDSVVWVLDTDGDGRADRTHVFATGFNAIQGLAWHGRDLWVANSPDLTVVRDLDGDDEADEYVRVYTDLGNLEHGLHGLNWGPDGKLYMSKGNSKGLTQPGRIAPRAFRELWGVEAPAGSLDFPPPQTFRKGEYRHAYHDPDDDWGKEGGVLRCDPGGYHLEIVARGFRNPWDITFDSGFNWLGTDNDQTGGDRVFMPFLGAHFGWNHPWSAHWSTDSHAPSAPVSGPLFEGSGTGVVFADSAAFPAAYRGVFFVNDWLRKTTFLWRPQWKGALLKPAGGDWEPFVQGGRSLYRPTDLEVGPDGALWILGWSAGYGAEYRDGQMTSEGRVFRVSAPAAGARNWRTAKRGKPLASWTVAELIEDFDGPLPVWRTDAQEELVRRGNLVRDELVTSLSSTDGSEARETWIAWTLGRLALSDATVDQLFATLIPDRKVSLNLRVQSVRILAHRVRGGGSATRGVPPVLVAALREAEPRLRFEAVQALHQAGASSSVASVLDMLANELDPTTFYAGWQALRRLAGVGERKRGLVDARAGVRRAALLSLLEEQALTEIEVRPLIRDPDAGVSEVAELWLRKASAGGQAAVVRGRPLQNSPPVPTVAPGRLVKNLQTRSRSSYRIQPRGLRSGAKPYTDRGYELKQVPEALAGADFIQTSNEDDGSQGSGWLTFEAVVPVRVHLAFDTRASSVPSWTRQRFQPTEVTLRADHWTFRLYSGEFPAGRVELGGNTDDGQPGGKGNYIVVLEPLPLKVPAEPTRLELTLGLVVGGDAERGEWLFHQPRGAGCFNCHRLREHGNAFGPDLSTLGDRATARHVVQSLLEPNAVITEGFNQHRIETAEESYEGILLEESGLSLTLGLASGQRLTLPKSSIRTRQTAKVSAMPAYDTLLVGECVADLAAYLLAQKAGGTGQSAPPRTGSSSMSFRVVEEGNRMVITHSGRPMAEFVFRDDRIKRPYFANVHAPDGTKATRNHPPLVGVDAVDHDTMHPGIWLGFGDISGVDFWRNKGWLEHVRVLERPVVQGDRVTFATECRLRSPAGLTLGSLTNQLAIVSLTNAYLFSWEAVFGAAESGLNFGDQEEMGFGARVATVLTEKSGGVITSSTGRRSVKDTWGQFADWCDYSGRVGEHRVGITLLADPRNFRGSWWHNRDYGVFVANPFGREAMKQGAKSSVTVPAGGTLRLRFGAAVHSSVHPEEFDPAWCYEMFTR